MAAAAIFPYEIVDLLLQGCQKLGASLRRVLAPRESIEQAERRGVRLGLPAMQLNDPALEVDALQVIFQTPVLVLECPVQLRGQVAHLGLLVREFARRECLPRASTGVDRGGLKDTHVQVRSVDADHTRIRLIQYLGQVLLDVILARIEAHRAAPIQFDARCGDVFHTIEASD